MKSTAETKTRPSPPSCTVPAPLAETTVVADDGTRLFVRSRGGTRDEAGAAATELRVFLSDGVACDGFIWKYLWEDLASVVAVTHWHYRGHGRSGPPADPARIDIPAHGADLTRVREAMGDPPCVLVGHSMGCQVLLESYRNHPKNVRGIVLMCGTFGNATSTFHGGPILELILPRLLDIVDKNHSIARALWSRIPTEMAVKLALRLGEVDPDKVHPEDLLPYLNHVTHVDFPMFLRMVRAAGDHSAEDVLPGLTIPVLIVAGERDTFTPPFLAEAMQKAIPGAELLMVVRGSHVAPIEQPRLVDDRILEFLRERVG